jgi:UDP-N-acetylmuramoylalanine--D-glutamate ligase
MNVLLLGLGRANSAVARYLLKRNDLVYLYEDFPDRISGDLQLLLHRGEIREYRDEDVGLVVSSPGFPMGKEIIRKMKSKGVPVIDELEFTYRHLNEPRIIAVTGTNGKSTTVALISEIFTAGGIRNFLGGNISPGRPFSFALFEDMYDYYILEVSSFQLMRIKSFRPHIAILTNISADHLNWHSDFDEYAHAKLRIFMNQRESDYAVLNADDVLIQNLSLGLKAQKVMFGTTMGTTAHLDGNFCYEGEIILPVARAPIPGHHNAMNILAAIAVAKICRVDNDSITKGIQEYKGLPHRLENIGSIHGVHYVNNSMCTNEEAAIASFKAVDGRKVVIVGGSQKGEIGTRYLSLIADEAKACIILGANADAIVRFFQSIRYNKYATAGNMTEAVNKAQSFAEVGDIIFLNPGYASFGLFRNFEDRGDQFRNAILEDR